MLDLVSTTSWRVLLLVGDGSALRTWVQAATELVTALSVLCHAFLAKTKFNLKSSRHQQQITAPGKKVAALQHITILRIVSRQLARPASKAQQWDVVFP